jgi:hypothetical protein
METKYQLYHNCSLRLVELHGRLGCKEYELHHCQGSYRNIITTHPLQMHHQMTPTDYQEKSFLHILRAPCEFFPIIITKANARKI